MLATILKGMGAVILALFLLMMYTLMKAASIADDCKGFDEHWNDRE